MVSGARYLYVTMVWAYLVGIVVQVFLIGIALFGTWNTALVVVQFIQPILATLRNDQPVVAAFHPVLAMIIFWLAFTIGLVAWRVARQTAPATA